MAKILSDKWTIAKGIDWVMDNDLETLKRAVAQSSNMANAAYAGNAANQDTSPSALGRMIAMRMRWSIQLGAIPSVGKFDFLMCHKMNDEKVAVFAVIHGKMVTMEDDWPLFPSDNLITRLRVLEG